MRCGGQSLNLTCANRVIMCDTWWNRAAEEQAFGRVFRLGQLRSTHNIRILARNTIDEEIDRMHQVKAEAIEHTMQDDGHATQFFSEFEITKVLEPEKWLAWVQQCIAEIYEEDGIVPESMDVDGPPDQGPNAQTNSTETEQSMTTAFQDMREQKVSPGKMNIFDLEDDPDDEYLPEDQRPRNPYGAQDIGRRF
jgi:helicase-like protein